ncbi:MAG: hypothetical protein Q9Q40_11945 [Acidobacteriota bacterium]|nr:hypothetical protein [Acidobacteriota bacterium]MDQ7088599.1 hypothetical protein [Acidobacteriota bacterium]
MIRASRWLLAGLVLLTAVGGVQARRNKGMRKVQGTVVAVHTAAAEGGIEVLVATLELRGGGEKLDVLLAPPALLEQAGFTVETGDVLRARVFSGAEAEAVRAQKVMVINRGTMMVLRTLHDAPLWSSGGMWQGGGCRRMPGGGGHGGGPRGGGMGGGGRGSMHR